MKRALIIGLLSLVAGAPLAAQNRVNFAWWNNPVLSKDLNLSEAQRASIHKIVSSYRPRLIDARAAVQKAEGDLQDILNAEHVDVSQAQPVIDRVANARAESTRVFTEMSIELRGVLTLEQWRQLVTKWGDLKRGERPTDTQSGP